MRFETNHDVKVLYLGTPSIAAKVLADVIGAGYNVVGVVTQEDKNVGRKKELEASPVKKVALEHRIPLFTPHKIRLDYSFADNLDFDVILCLAYGQIVPEGFLKLAHIGAINLHGSLLPELRGAAPIQRAIMNGKLKTGVTLMEMVAAMDAGKMYDKKEVEILPSDNYTILAEKISEAASELIVPDLLKYANGELKGEEQREKDVSFANKIKPEDEHLPLSLSTKEALNYIRALSMEPGAYLFLEEKKMKIYHASIYSSDVIRAIGELIPDKKRLLVQFYDGILSLDEVQLEGKKKMDAPSFLNGAHLSEHVAFK